MKEVASVSALALTLLLFIPYIRAIGKKSIVPHVFSWTIWAFGTFVVFLAQLAAGGGLGAWPIGFSACITGYIAWLAFLGRSRLTVTQSDRVLFVLAALAVPSWLVTEDPLWAVIFLTLADLLGFGPTLRKTYLRPFEEHAGFFALGAMRNVLVIIALEAYSWTTILFPAAVGAACMGSSLFIMVRRRMVPITT